MGTASGASVIQGPRSNDSEDLNLTSLNRFAKFFKGYMGVMPIFMAALAPVLTIAKTIPVYDQQSKSLATYTGVLGFLMVAFVFYLRHPIARLTLTNESADAKFVRKWLNWLPSRGQALRGTMYVAPLLLIGTSVSCFVSYNVAVNDSLSKIRLLELDRIPDLPFPPATKSAEEELSARIVWLKDQNVRVPTASDALADRVFPVPDSLRLILYYLGIFVFAELAFFIMALREYLQSLLAISDQALIEGLKPGDGNDDTGAPRNNVLPSDTVIDESAIQKLVGKMRAANLIAKY